MTKNTLSIPHIDDYLLYLQTNNYSEETLYNYERDLSVFEHFLKLEHVAFKDVNKQVIQNYKAYLFSIDRKTANNQKTEKKLESFSTNRYLSVLRSFLKYLIEMDFEHPLSPNAIKLVRTTRKHAQVPEFEDIIALIESPTAFENDALIKLRNRAMLELLFATGMRISELIHLNRSQIDSSGKIFILGKGKKERFVYMTPRAKTHLESYLAVRHDASTSLFIPYRGRNNQEKNKRISPNYLQYKIKQYRELLQISVPISAHTLRHGFATYLAEQGANPAAIQVLLGHESLDTTTRYVNTSDRFAQESHSKFHPLQDDD